MLVHGLRVAVRDLTRRLSPSHRPRRLPGSAIGVDSGSTPRSPEFLVCSPRAGVASRRWPRLDRTDLLAGWDLRRAKPARPGHHVGFDLYSPSWADESAHLHERVDSFVTTDELRCGRRGRNPRILPRRFRAGRSFVSWSSSGRVAIPGRRLGCHDPGRAPGLQTGTSA